MLKYEGKKQLKRFIMESSFIIIEPRTSIVYFAGPKLDNCSLKLNVNVIEEIIVICDLLEIKYTIIVGGN